MKTKTTYSWFPGLNALRIMAALLVVIMHIHSNQARMGLPTLPDFPILSKGLYAVSFFFVLSGFLITYLLFKEQTKSKTINVKAFYWRRVFRIWPLYFFVVGAGLLFYWLMVPQLGIDFTVEYSKPLAVTLYLLFGANLMNSLFHVGGMLHITWSIAVEEQFYLFWAPLAKKVKRNIEPAAAIIVILSLSINTLNQMNAFELSSGMQQFVHTLQFHYMGIGALLASHLFKDSQSFLNLKMFKNKQLQLVLYSTILLFLFGYQKTEWAELVLPLPIGLLFGWLIINTACNPRAVFNLENKISHYLGSISYGVYMLHMPVVYAMSFLMSKTSTTFTGSAGYFGVYYLGTILVTFLLADLSFRFLESPILSYGRNFLKPTSNKSQALREQKLTPAVQ